MKDHARVQLDEVPRREQLEALVRHYHHLQNEHQRAAPEGRVRRRIEERLLDVRDRFDKLLLEWVPENDLADQWRAHLNYRAPAPAGPPPIRPLVFHGISEAGSVADIRVKNGSELQVIVDGALVERLYIRDPATLTSFQLNGADFAESFTAPTAAVAALSSFVDRGGIPPWEHAEGLLADGLIDVHFALTPRGRRALARTA